MRSSTKLDSRLSPKMFQDKQLVHDRQTAGDAIGLVDNADEKVEEINANYLTSEVSHLGLGNEGMEKQEMMKDDTSFKNEIVDKSRNPQLPESNWNGDDRGVDTVDGSPPEQRRTTTRDVTQTTSHIKCVRFEKDAKDDDGGTSHRSTRRNVVRNTKVSDQEPPPSCPCSCFWKRVRKFFGKHTGRVLRFIGMGALVSPPLPETHQVHSWSENQNASPSYGMLLF